ncbi:28859_t:CDS:2, partial [Dentiscutata erythropus]
RTRTLPNIEVVRQNNDNHPTNSLLEESNRSNNEDVQRPLPISLDLNHSKVNAEIFCKDKSSTPHEPDSKMIELDHEKAIDSTTASQSMTDILKRKQDLLQGFDWIGVSISSSINVTNNANSSDSFEKTNRSRSISRRYSKEALTSTHFRRLDSPSLSTKLSKESMHETTTVVDVATVIDSMAPLEQTNTSEPSISEFSIEWHHFLSANDECTSKIAESPPPSYIDTDLRILEANNSPISTSRTIETSALHSIVPQSVISTNVAWNNFLRTSDVTSNVDFDEDDNENLDINTSISEINSSKLSSKKIVTNKKYKRSNFDEFAKNSIDNEDNL